MQVHGKRAARSSFFPAPAAKRNAGGLHDAAFIQWKVKGPVTIPASQEMVGDCHPSKGTPVFYFYVKMQTFEKTWSAV